MSAVISDCGKYRYVLRRSTGSVLRWYKPCLFIMLNPSTADDVNDDPTIRRCLHFAKREGMTHLNVVNLFAFRATNPKELLTCDDPVGPENDDYIKEEIDGCELVIAAWGSNPIAAPRALELRNKFDGVYHCLGKTKKGHPRHPLYLRNDAPLLEL